MNIFRNLKSHARKVDPVALFKSLVGGYDTTPVRNPQQGEVRQFGEKDVRKFDAQRHRWIDADEYDRIQNRRMKFNLGGNGQQQAEGQPQPKTSPQTHNGDKVAVAKHAEAADEHRNPHESRFNVLRNVLKQYSGRTAMMKDEIEDFIAKFHPHSKADAAQAANLIPQAVRDHVKEMPTEKRYFNGEKWREDRIHMHRKFVEHRVRGVKEGVPDGQREAIILAGGGGSGKSSVARKLFGNMEKDKSAVWADADVAKEAIPEYKIMFALQDKDGAGIVHEESSAMNKAVIDEALRRKQNLVIDGQLGDPKKAHALYDKLKQNGYKVTLVLVNADYEKALHRAMKRFSHTFRLPSPSELRKGNEGAPVSFWQLAKRLDFGDAAIAVDNSDREPVVAFERRAGNNYLYNGEVFKKLLAKGKAEEHGKDFVRNAEIHRKEDRGIAKHYSRRVGASKEGSGDSGGRSSRRSLLDKLLGRRNAGTEKVSAEREVTPNLFPAFGKSQMGLFGGETATAAPPAAPPKSKSATSSTGVSWKRMGLEKPNHKYIRRFRNKAGEWEYVYRDQFGQEFEGNAEGEPLPRTRNWQEGDPVHVGTKTGKIVKVGDETVAVKFDNGDEGSYFNYMVEHGKERQRRLWSKKGYDEGHWQSLIDELEADLEQGKESGQYETADSKAELERKIKYAKEESESAKASLPPDEKPQELPAPPKDESQYVKQSEYNRALRSAYFDDKGNYIASSREKKAEYPKHPIGTWKIDDDFKGIYGSDIEQLREFDPHDLMPSESSTERMDDAQRYAGWRMEGDEPPPINVLQTENGHYKITDGHRRWIAAMKSGKKIKAWVSPITGTGKFTSSGKELMTGLTHELANGRNLESERQKAEEDEKKSTQKPDAKTFYHGSGKPLVGELKIDSKSKTGIGGNSATLGNAIYLTESEPAARLFSHVSKQNHVLSDENLSAGERLEKVGQVGMGNVYQVKVNPEAKIYDAEKPLDAKTVRALLKEAGVPAKLVASHKDSEVSDFQIIQHLLQYAKKLDVKQNAVEWFMKKLGYDGIRIRESSWDDWQYFPREAGIDYHDFSDTPVTVAIYNDKMIEGYKENEDERYKQWGDGMVKSIGGEDMIKGMMKRIFTALQEAREDVDKNPTEAQKKAGNYAKGHVRLHGLDIALENPKGGTRSGIDPDGKPWKVKMRHDYGYIKRTEGKDGDHVDVFIGEDPKSEIVFVVNQIDPKTGKFDEHKVMMGFSNEEEAIRGYKANYTDDASQRIGAVIPQTMEQFKKWLDNGDTTKPLRKSQMNLFGAEEHHIGDVKSEDGKNYIFLESTIGKPRWHSAEDAATLHSEGLLTPESKSAFTAKREAINPQVKIGSPYEKVDTRNVAKEQKRIAKRHEGAEWEDFESVVRQAHEGKGNFEVGEVYWWTHPNKIFDDFSREVIVAGKEVNGKVPVYSYTHSGNKFLPPRSAVAELTPKEQLSTLAEHKAKATPKLEAPKDSKPTWKLTKKAGRMPKDSYVGEFELPDGQTVNLHKIGDGQWKLFEPKPYGSGETVAESEVMGRSDFVRNGGTQYSGSQRARRYKFSPEFLEKHGSLKAPAAESEQPSKSAISFSRLNLNVGDIVKLNGKNGAPDTEANFRGYNDEGGKRFAVVVMKNGVQISVPQEDIAGKVGGKEATPHEQFTEMTNKYSDVFSSDEMERLSEFYQKEQWGEGMKFMEKILEERGVRKSAGEISFARLKKSADAAVGDTKTEGESTYQLREVTPTRPRWFRLDAQEKRPKIRSVAFKINGKLYAGEPKQGHAQLYETLPPDAKKEFDRDDSDIQDGFMTSDGKFLTRAEVQKAFGVIPTSEAARESGLFETEEVKKAFVEPFMMRKAGR